MLKQEELDGIEAMSALCSLKTIYDKENDCFISPKINGVELQYEDFGEKYDIDEENAEEYCCGNMQFIPYDYIPDEILKKYNITLEEARLIQKKLDCLSFGCCGWCS